MFELEFTIEQEEKKTMQTNYHSKRLPDGRFAPKDPNQPINPDVFGKKGKIGKKTKKTNKVVAGPDVTEMVNHVAILLDSSGSMSSFSTKVVDEFNNTLDTIQENAQRTGIKTTVSVWTFGESYTPVRQLYIGQDVRLAKKMSRGEYRAQGNTPLWDCVGASVVALRDKLKQTQKTSNLVIILTDGENNASYNYNEVSLMNLIKSVQSTDRWTFAFQVPRGYKTKLVNLLGIPSDNVVEWEQTDVGFRTTNTMTRNAVATYYTAGAATGSTSTKSFYTDLSKLTPTVLKNKLQDVSSNVKLYRVEKEQEIKPFVEDRTKKPYVAGSAFYALTKTEKVQPDKQLLVKEKTGTAIYTGKEARTLLGFPDDGTTVRVKPGNHSNYDVFIQSSSDNRILVRGTQVAVLKNVT